MTRHDQYDAAGTLAYTRRRNDVARSIATEVRPYMARCVTT